MLMRRAEILYNFKSSGYCCFFRLFILKVSIVPEATEMTLLFNSLTDWNEIRMKFYTMEADFSKN